MLKLLAWDKKSLENDTPDHDFTSPENTNKHVVVVMDGMTEFTTEPLQWALDNVVTVECAVTLVGVMPWLNIPLSSKTRNDFWMVEMEDPPLVKEKNECRNDKYLKCHAVIDLCRKYGVVPQKKIVMGYPLRMLVVEQLVTLCPTWVLFDRSHRRNREFYAKKIPCNILMMNEDGRIDMIKSKQKMIRNDDSSSREFSMLSSATPQLAVSEESRQDIK
ncbi:unnamed protein product [Vicia faba]|uniref:Uncharacterized protein n=1 Tax=Vicia faba TaxID=3906 RepID=A0AAV0YPZ7_VICFA|nr:unnamed protein product [Vicia faba]